MDGALYCAAGLVLIALGITMIANPQFIFDLTERWKYGGGGEPSHMFILSTRIGGVLCALSGIFGIIATFIPE